MVDDHDGGYPLRLSRPTPSGAGLVVGGDSDGRFGVAGGPAASGRGQGPMGWRSPYGPRSRPGACQARPRSATHPDLDVDRQRPVELLAVLAALRQNKVEAEQGDHSGPEALEGREGCSSDPWSSSWTPRAAGRAGFFRLVRHSSVAPSRKAPGPRLSGVNQAAVRSAPGPFRFKCPTRRSLWGGTAPSVSPAAQHGRWRSEARATRARGRVQGRDGAEDDGEFALLVALEVVLHLAHERVHPVVVLAVRR